jgi:hypothetical protein
MQAVGSFEVFVNIYKTRRRHIPKDGNLHSYYREKLWFDNILLSTKFENYQLVFVEINRLAVTSMDRIWKQMHTSFLQTKSMLIYIYAWITSFLKW